MKLSSDHSWRCANSVFAHSAESSELENLRSSGHLSWGLVKPDEVSVGVFQPRRAVGAHVSDPIDRAKRGGVVLLEAHAASTQRRDDRREVVHLERSDGVWRRRGVRPVKQREDRAVAGGHEDPRGDLSADRQAKILVERAGTVEIPDEHRGVGESLVEHVITDPF